MRVVGKRAGRGPGRGGSITMMEVEVEMSPLVTAPILGCQLLSPLLLGFAGPAGCGKSTAASLLAAHGGWERLSFAAPLRELLLALHPAWDQWRLGPGKDMCQADGGLSPREQLRAAGDWVKRYEPGFFANIMRRQLLANLELGRHVVIDDVRFEGEARLIREMGGTVCHVSRTDVHFRRDHNSEMGVEPDPSDLYLRNWDGLRALGGELDYLLEAAVQERAHEREQPADGAAVATLCPVG